MKQLTSSTLCLILLILFSTCNDDDITSREYPRIKTLPVDEITSTGAKLNAEIISPGSSEVISYGFVWGLDKDPALEEDESVESVGSIDGHITATITSALKENQIYSVKAFVRTSDYLVYGQEVSFLSLGSEIHEVSRVYPQTVSYGDTIRIEGQRFSAVADNIKVNIGEFEMEIFSTSDSLITAIVPNEQLEKESVLSVSIYNNIVFAKNKISLQPIILSEIIPSSGKSFDTLNLFGAFGHLPEYTKVSFNEHQSEIVNAYDSLIQVVVPPGIESNHQLKITIGSQSTLSSDFVYLKPVITDFPDSITWSEPAFIKGENFQTNSCCSKVLIAPSSSPDYFSECTVVQRTDTAVLFQIPLNFVGYNSFHLVLQDAEHDLIFESQLSTPKVDKISPKSYSYGSEIIIQGSNFHPTQNYIEVIGDNEISATPITQEANQISFSFPISSQSSNGKFTLKIYTGLNSSSAAYEFDEILDIGELELVDFQPKEITTYTRRLTISGNGFSPDLYNNEVTVNNQGLTVIEANQNQLTVDLFTILEDPNISASVQGTLRVTSGGQTKNFDDSIIVEYKAPWGKISTLPSNRAVIGSSYITVNNKIYLLSGSLYYGDLVTDVFEFSSENQSWQTITSLPDQGRLFSLVQAGNNRFFYGLGQRNSRSLFDIYSFDITSNQWQTLTTFPSHKNPPRGYSAFSPASYFDDKLNVLYMDSIFIFDQNSEKWVADQYVNFESSYENGSMFGEFGFVINNEPYLVFIDRNNTDVSQWKASFYSKSNTGWNSIGLIDEWSGSYKNSDLEQNGLLHTIHEETLYMSYLNSLYKVNLETLSLTPIPIPNSFGYANIVFISSINEMIYVGLSDNTIWRYLP